MRKLMTALLLLAAFLSACSFGIDRKKFAMVRKDAKAIDRALEQMTNYVEFEKLLNDFASHLAEAGSLMATEKEKKLFAEYRKLLVLYRDADVFWQYKVESYSYAWIPKGRVYVDDELRPVVVKYGFKTEKNYTQLTDHHWESVSADDLKVILEKAKEQYETTMSW